MNTSDYRARRCSPAYASPSQRRRAPREGRRRRNKRLHAAIGARVVGQEGVVDLMLVALLARGHALLVGVPGLAKTLLVASLAEALALEFGRVQFTPDLLPADITGTDVLQEEDDANGGTRRRVRFLAGPIFHNLVLADEINRTPPKTQAALLQAMQERRVTVGTTTHRLPDPFQVFATRNPIEQEGTYPLPEAQLDRFLLEIHIDYPSEVEEREIARRTTSAEIGVVPRVLSVEDVRALQNLVPRIPVTDEAVRLAVALGRATRPSVSGAGGAARPRGRGVRPLRRRAARLSGARSRRQGACRSQRGGRGRRRRRARPRGAGPPPSPRPVLPGGSGRGEGRRRPREGRASALAGEPAACMTTSAAGFPHGRGERIPG